MYYTMAQEGATGWLLPLIKRDPFEQAVGQSVKTATGLGGALAAPSTAYLYDWNILPIGQQLWLKELESYNTFPPLQAPETYNLSGILAQVKKANESAPGD
jgi:arylsulfatase